MRGHDKLSNNLPLKLDLSTEVLPAQTLVEIFGTQRVVIENHKGVVQYDNCQICVKKQKGIRTNLPNFGDLTRIANQKPNGEQEIIYTPPHGKELLQTLLIDMLDFIYDDDSRKYIRYTI